jgi:O-antigen/teichoic acid export membrane protein
MSRAFLKSVSYVLSGTFLAQLIPIAGTFVLARIFTPSSFGQYSVWLGIVLFLSVVVTCRFEMSLAVEDDGAARYVAVAMTLVTIVLGSIIATAMLFVVLSVSKWTIIRLPMGLLLITIPTAALLAATQTLQNWAAADGRYTHLSVNRLVQATSIVLLQIGLGLIRPDSSCLGFGYLAGIVVALSTGFILMPISGFQLVNIIKKLVDFWKSQKRFPLYSLPADSLSAATAQLPVIIVASRFGEDAAGLLSMALRMVGAPMALLSSSVLDVFKRHASTAFRDRGECRAEYLHAFRILLVVAFVSSIAIISLSKPLFALFFDHKWLGASAFCIWLLPRFALGFVASPLSYIVYIVGKQQIDLAWQITLIGMTVPVLFLVGSLQSSVSIYAWCYGFLYLIYIAMSYRFSMGNK